MYHSIDFFQFQKKFSTENKCLKYLSNHRWHNGFVCPKCGNHEYYFIKSRLNYQCKQCNYQSSVISRTIFHKTRIPFRKWFWMIYLLAQNKNSYSVLGLQKLLQIKSYKTAWLMAHKIRKAMADRDTRYKLGGLIEMDDAYFGKSRATGKRGRGASKKACVIVSVNVNEQAKPVFATMSVVSAVDSKNVSSVVQKNIHPASVVKTDGWPSYQVIKEQGLKHEKTIVGNPKNASKVLPWVHILIANCKSALRGTHHGISSKHLHRYLSEFCYRFNRRFWQNQLFDRLVHACLSSKTITFSELSI